METWVQKPEVKPTEFRNDCILGFKDCNYNPLDNKTKEDFSP